MIRGLAYDAIELATARRGLRRTVDGVQIRFPARVARYYPRVYDPAKRDFVLQHCTAGSIAIDAGAHIGLYSVLMARAVGPPGRVLAFEPAPATYAMLCRTLALNGADNVEPRAQALAGSAGPGRLALGRHPYSNVNSVVGAPSSDRTVAVEAMTLDSVLAGRGDRVSLLKLDIEGAELDALRGSAHTIERFRPAIALEVHPARLPEGPASLPELWDLLAQSGYRVRRAGAEVGRQWFCAQRDSVELGALPVA